MPDNDNIHDDIRAINTTLQAMAGVQAANSAKLDSLNDRLFAEGSGVIPGMWAEIKEARKESTEACTRTKTQRAWVAGAGAAGVAFAAVLRGLLGRLGIHF